MKNIIGWKLFTRRPVFYDFKRGVGIMKPINQELELIIKLTEASKLIKEKKAVEITVGYTESILLFYKDRVYTRRGTFYELIPNSVKEAEQMIEYIKGEKE